MANNREYYKSLVANNQNDQLINLLLETISWHKTQYEDATVAKKHDEMLLLSSRNQNIGQAANQGILNASDVIVEENKINLALLSIINTLPEAFFAQIDAFMPSVTPSSGVPFASNRPQQALAIPSGLGKGMYWIMATFLGMISAGAAIQSDWVAFALTAVATALCAPASYEWMSTRTRITMSNALRVLLIITLMCVGLSFATPR